MSSKHNPKRSVVISTTLVVMGAVILGSPIALAATNPSSTPAAEPTSTKAAEKLAERVTKYKAKQALKLTTTEETKLKGVCKTAQIKVKTLGTAADNATTARTKVFDAVTKQLTTVTSRIKDADADIADLELVKTELAKRVTQYKTDLAVYKTDLADLSEVDCVTDPTAFKAALLSARADLTTVAASVKNIRDYLPTIKEKLLAARVAIAAAKAVDDKKATTEGAQ